MIVGVADTHTAIWYLLGNDRLSADARNFLEWAAENEQHVALSSISLVEITYLVEKKRLEKNIYQGVLDDLKAADRILTEAHVTVEIVNSMWQVSRAEIPDMPDRIIAATALRFNVPLITRDGRIRASNLQTIW